MIPSRPEISGRHSCCVLFNYFEVRILHYIKTQGRRRNSSDRRSLRVRSRITSHFGIPSSRHPRGTFAPSSAAPQSQIFSTFEAVVDNRYLVEDLYADARPCLEELQRAYYFVGIVGNQPAERESDLMAMELPSDLIATSGRWGVKKPNAAFFDRIVSESGFPAGEVV